MVQISIIIPIYNKAIYLNDIFQDLKRQIFADFECILVNDGSTDESRNICDHIAALDVRFRVFHIANRGVSHARNIGLLNAKGKYVVFIDADDRIPENYLLNLYKSINNTKTDIAVCGAIKFWNDGKNEKISMPAKGLYGMKALLSDFALRQKETGIYGYCWGKIFSLELIKNIYFNEQINLAEDFEFLLRVYPKCTTILFFDDTNYFYRKNAENSLSVADDYKIDYYTQLKISLKYRSFLKKMGVYDGTNKEIIDRMISDYVFFTIFYCNIKEFNFYFNKLKRIYKTQKMQLLNMTFKEKYFLILLFHNQKQIARWSLCIYRFMRNNMRKLINSFL